MSEHQGRLLSKGEVGVRRRWPPVVAASNLLLARTGAGPSLSLGFPRPDNGQSRRPHALAGIRALQFRHVWWPETSAGHHESQVDSAVTTIVARLMWGQLSWLKFNKIL